MEPCRLRRCLGKRGCLCRKVSAAPVYAGVAGQGLNDPLDGSFSYSAPSATTKARQTKAMERQPVGTGRVKPRDSAGIRSMRQPYSPRSSTPNSTASTVLHKASSTGEAADTKIDARTAPQPKKGEKKNGPDKRNRGKPSCSSNGDDLARRLKVLDAQITAEECASDVGPADQQRAPASATATALPRLKKPVPTAEPFKVILRYNHYRKEYLASGTGEAKTAELDELFSFSSVLHMLTPGPGFFSF